MDPKWKSINTPSQLRHCVVAVSNEWFGTKLGFFKFLVFIFRVYRFLWFWSQLGLIAVMISKIQAQQTGSQVTSSHLMKRFACRAPDWYPERSPSNSSRIWVFFVSCFLCFLWYFINLLLSVIFLWFAFLFLYRFEDFFSKFFVV